MIYTLGEYARRLATAEDRLAPAVEKVVVRGALNIRDDWRRRARAKNPRHAPKYPGTIVMRRAVIVSGQITAVVEPGSVGQGRLGQVLEHGHGGARNKPQLSHVQAMVVEAPKLAEWLARLSKQAIT